MLNSAEFDNRPVAWGDIIGKPDAYEPAAHYHDAGDIYGFEYVVTAIERVRSAILIGDDATHDEIYRYIDNWGTQLGTQISTLQAQLNAHKADTTNPHATTKLQVGLGNVDNFLTATQAQAEAGTLNTLFMTPLRTAQAITLQAVTPLNNHIARVDNPHVVTKAQVGLGNVSNFPVATLSQAQAGTDNASYMTPYLTAQAITIQAGGLLAAHINDTNNPHQTTKAQVGLSNVQNYGVATNADAIAGLSNTLYMTPVRTADEIAALVGNAFTAHVNNLSNPHQTTKTQVGLSNVDNFATANQADAQAGTRNDLFMTPLRTAQAITVQSGSLLAVHTQRTDNPHSVTKAQVGLGNVSNFATATNADAIAGTSNVLFMTPALVKSSIAQFAAAAWYQGFISNPGWAADSLPGSRSGFTYSNGAPYTGPLVCFDAGGYNLQLNSAYNGQGLAYRTHNQDSNLWNGWKALAHADGTNAGGTWGINITGSAGSATNATNSTNSSWANGLVYLGNVSNSTGGYAPGGYLQGVYNTGQPAPYGNVLTLQGGGTGQLLIGWSGTTGGIADNYIRSMRDQGGTWSPWAKIITDQNGDGSYLSKPNGGAVAGGVTFNGATAFNADAVFNTNVRTGNWWRSVGNTGWYNETYGGGWYQTQAGYVDGYNGVSIRATDFWTSSDERIKTNVVQIKNARQRLFGTVSGCTFDKNGVPSMGLLAQQVQKEFDIAVIETNEALPDGSKILTVNYGIMIAPVIEAAREIDEDVTKLRADHEELKTAHAALKTEMDQMKVMLQTLLNK